MDNYGELTFQNAMDCLPIDVHLESKSRMDELVRNDENNSTFKMTFTDISVGGTTSIDDSEVSLGDVIVQQGVTELGQNGFLFSTNDNSTIPITVQTDSLTGNVTQLSHQLHIIENTQGEIIHVVHQPSSLHVIGNTQIVTQIFHESSSSLSRIDDHVSQIDTTNDSTVTIQTIKNESSNFSQESIQNINETGLSCTVEHDIENILNNVSPSSNAVFTSEEKKVDFNNSLNENVYCEEIIQKGKSNKKKKTDERHECKVCGKRFREKSHLATHSRAHVDIRNFKCEVCGLKFKTKANLCFHSQTHSETPFTCTECNKTFAERKILKRHIRVVHSCKELHKCNQCDKSFKSAAILSLHYTLHSGNKPFRCSMCPKSFVYKSTLAMHISQYHQCTLCLPSSCRHRSRSWLCTICGKGYSLKATLSTHMKSHDPDKLFKCTECPKTFVKKQFYEIHMKLHRGEGPQYMCDQCSQSYFNVFSLRRHYIKHTSQRNFVCEICSKAFWMKDALKVHMRSHSNEKPFQCTKCPKAFAHKHTLEGHMKTHRSNQDQTIINKEFSSPSVATDVVITTSGIQQQHTLSSPLSPQPSSYLHYQLPPPLQPATHIIVSTQTDQQSATTHNLHVL